MSWPTFRVSEAPSKNERGGTRCRIALTVVSTTPGAAASGRSARAASVSTRSEEHTSELQSLMRTSYAVFCLKKQHTQCSHHYQQQKRNRTRQNTSNK